MSSEGCGVGRTDRIVLAENGHDPACQNEFCGCLSALGWPPDTSMRRTSIKRRKKGLQICHRRLQLWGPSEMFRFPLFLFSDHAASQSHMNPPPALPGVACVRTSGGRTSVNQHRQHTSLLTEPGSCTRIGRRAHYNVVMRFTRFEETFETFTAGMWSFQPGQFKTCLLYTLPRKRSNLNAYV